MSFTATRAESPFALSDEAIETLERRVDERRLERSRRERAPGAGGRHRRRSRQSSTCRLPCWRARRADDRFFCFEQPDRDGFVLAGLGSAIALESRGPGRFREVAVRARDLGRRAFVDDASRDPDRPAAAGPVFVGGFAFSDDGGATPEWSLARAGVARAARRSRSRATAARRA